MDVDISMTLEPGEAPHAGAERLLAHVQYWYSLVLLLIFFFTAAADGLIAVKNEVAANDSNIRGPDGNPLPQTKKRKKDVDPNKNEPVFSPAAMRAFRLFSIFTVLSLVAQFGAVIGHYLSSAPAPGFLVWSCDESMLVYLLSALSLHLYLTLTLFDWNDVPGIAHSLTWGFALLAEGTLLVCTLLTKPLYLDMDYQASILADAASGGMRMDRYLVADVGLYTFRVALLAFACGLYFITPAPKSTPTYKVEGRVRDSQEAVPLISSGGYRSYNTQRNNPQATRSRRNGHAPGQANGAVEGLAGKDEEAAFYRPEKLPRMSLLQYCKGYFVFVPYLWPHDNKELQMKVLLCFSLVLAERAVNMQFPLQVGRLIGTLETSQGQWQVMKSLVWLFLLKFIQGSSGALGNWRSFQWVPVQQYSYRSLAGHAFEHVHSLSLDFHLSKRTGEVLSALNKGASINVFLEQVTFQVVPMFMDLFLAIYVFYFQYDALFATVVGLVAFWYLYLTIRMAQTRADQRREMSNADREEEAVKNDSITSYETVKYFNAEEFEFRRYKNAVCKFQEAEAKVTKGMNYMSISQNCVYMAGFIAAVGLGAYQVKNGQRTVGQFAMLLTYMTQLQGPLNVFNGLYRTIQQAMISGERLLELFKIQPTVVDKPGVPKLAACQGLIRWRNVSFRYDPRRPALKNIDFECAPGTTTAFVGESGGGKSTIFRLMFRYYNCGEGRIEIDGHDVKDLTIDSVRRFIGVVPQDTILFNETIMYNLKYANQSATDEDVYAACRAASIHDRIMEFPDGYRTKVGDRGVRLSGGEKQRVAIARTMLKSPKIIMLDEATSALDSHTEQEIQDKLGQLGEGRTVMIIAHRLSTITHADQIIYLDNAEIVEKGTHEELLAAKGRYAEMWEKQIRAQRAEERAAEARRKAHRLLRQANMPMKKQQPGSPDGYTSMTSSTILAGPPDESRPHSPEDSRPHSPIESGNSSDSDEHVYCGKGGAFRFAPS